jgi:hypothetical protein
MLKQLLSFLFIFFTIAIQAQTNLVPNPSFETYTLCPNDAAQINYAIPWYSPTTGTTDYYNSCYDSIALGNDYYSAPLNYIGFQKAIDGIAYAGLFVYYYPGPVVPPATSTYREYLQAPLTNTLISYYVSFYASLADSCKFATDDIGAYFSATQISRTDYKAFTYTPQITNPIGNILSNKTIWYKISGTFVASGGEKYITIGNFKNDSLTDTLKVRNYSALTDYNSSYFYIDYICVSTDSLTCNASVGIQTYYTSGNINIYSNNSTLYLKGVKESANIEMYDVEGRLIMIQKVDRGGNKVNLSSFNDGIYTIKTSSNNQQQINKICLIKN